MLAVALAMGSAPQAGGARSGSPTRSEPQVKHCWHGISRLGYRAWLGTCLLLLVPGPLSLRAAASDPLGLEAAVAEVRAALEEMTDAVNGAPRQVQTTVGADLHLTGQAIARTLDELEPDAVPIPDPTLVYDLNLLADIARAATDELRAIALEPGAGPDPERGQRIDRLTEAAAARLAEIDLVVDGWNERSRDAVVEVQDDNGVLLIRSTDRLVYNGIRYVSVALLLIGLLALGLHLLRTGPEAHESWPRVPQSPLLPGLGTVALVAFFGSCLVFSLRPDTLGALSAKVRVQAQEHPCERLAAQRDRLIAAQQADHAGLIEATKQRMRPAAQDCLGLPTAAVTAEAIDRLAARTAVARDQPPSAGTPAVGLTAAGSRRGLPGTASPPGVAELQPAEMQASGGLAELLANLRVAEKPEAHPPAAAGPAELPRVVRGPAKPASEPAAPAIAPIQPAIAPIEPAAGPADTAVLESPPDPVPPKPPAESEPETFITTTTLNYREGPSVDARRLGTLVAGARLHVTGQDAGWAQVRLGDGRQAYVATEFLEPAP